MVAILRYFQKKKRLWIVPVYGMLYMWLFSLLEKQHTAPGTYHLIQCPIDRLIPFSEVFIIPYLSWFVFVLLAFAYVSFADRDVTGFNRFCLYLFTGMTIFLLVSLVWPNGIDLRPGELPRTNLFTALCERLWRKDTPTNVFPSIHVFNSLSIALACRNMRGFRHSRAARVAIDIWAALIVLSTMFVKQHSVYDVIGGLAMSCFLYIVIYQREPNAHRARQRRTAAQPIDLE